MMKIAYWKVVSHVQCWDFFYKMYKDCFILFRFAQTRVIFQNLYYHFKKSKILTLRDFVLKQRQIEEEIMMIGKINLVKSGKKSTECSTRNRLNEFSWSFSFSLSHWNWSSFGFWNCYPLHHGWGIMIFNTKKMFKSESYWSLRRLNCVSFTVHSRATTV